VAMNNITQVKRYHIGKVYRVCAREARCNLNTANRL
jgi:histidyl-tRNA synthetase